MAHRTKGVVAASAGAPVTLEEIIVPDPGAGEAARAGRGVRRLPHGPALPGGGDHRRVPVPTGTRGRPAPSRQSATAWTTSRSGTS